MRRVAWGMPALSLLAMTARAQAPASPEERVLTLFAGRTFPLTRLVREAADGSWRQFRLGDADDLYITRGDLFQVGETAFLVAYRPRAPRPARLADETALELSLVNLRTVARLTNIAPFDPKTATSPVSAPPAPRKSPVPRSDPAAGASLQNLKQLGTALLLYIQDYDGTLPPLQSPGEARRALLPYVKNDTHFVCPIDRQPYATNPALSGRKMAHLATPGSFVVLFENRPGADGTRGIVFANGQAKRIYEAEWPRLKQLSKIP